eukprot:4599893-Prymnesium_polylepis.1
MSRPPSSSCVSVTMRYELVVAEPLVLEGLVEATVLTSLKYEQPTPEELHSQIRTVAQGGPARFKCRSCALVFFTNEALELSLIHISEPTRRS